jgi:hypothetical protein
MLYTITEAIKIFEIGLANQSSAAGSTFWQNIERKGVVPNRSAESMRGFWKVNKKTGLEKYIGKAMHDQNRFSHNYPTAPCSRQFSTSSNVEDRVISLAMGNPPPEYTNPDVDMND